MFRRHHLELGAHMIALSTVIGAALAVAALVGMAWVAGPARVLHDLIRPDWAWFGVALGAEAAAYVGYTAAYREVLRAAHGPAVDVPTSAALVASGFGVFIPRGGFAADLEALRSGGTPAREARGRVLGLGILEYLVLAPAAIVAAAVLVVTRPDVSASVTIPWLAAAPLGFAAALWALRHRERWARAGGWRATASQGLEAFHGVRRLARRPRSAAAAGLGMALYWAGDIACLGACLRAISGHRPSLAALVVAYATGYALTRRTLPFAGAGAVEVLLPLALAWVGMPLPEAVAAVLAYRIVNLWLPSIPGVGGFVHVRRAVGPGSRASRRLIPRSGPRPAREEARPRRRM